MLKNKKTAILKVSAGQVDTRLFLIGLGLFSNMLINLKGVGGEGMLLPASYDISHAPIYCQRAMEHNPMIHEFTKPIPIPPRGISRYRYLLAVSADIDTDTYDYSYFSKPATRVMHLQGYHHTLIRQLMRIYINWHFG